MSQPENAATSSTKTKRPYVKEAYVGRLKTAGAVA
jgi:hypothetical protein